MSSLILSGLILSLALFTIGVIGVVIKRDALSVLMSIELMLNAANLTILSAAKKWGEVDGAILILFVITVAAAEAGVGLAIFIHLFRFKGNINLDKQTLLCEGESAERIYE